MGLAERIEEARPKGSTSVDRELSKLTAEDMAALIAAAKDERWTNVQLRELLAKEGVNLSREAFSKWRRNVSSR